MKQFVDTCAPGVRAVETNVVVRLLPLGTFDKNLSKLDGAARV